MVHSDEYRRQPGDLEWDGAVNARVIAGDFVRMGRREWMSEQGWAQARAHGVHTVIDLRGEAERVARADDPAVSTERFEGMTVLHRPIERAGNHDYESATHPYMNDPCMYRLVLESFPDLVAQALTDMASVEGPCIVHCSAGRDRTGLIATLLLSLLGREEQVFTQDELAVRGINEWRRVALRPHPHERLLTDQQLTARIAERAEALTDFLMWLGSADAWLRTAGVPEAALHRLAAKAMSTAK